MSFFSIRDQADKFYHRALMEASLSVERVESTFHPPPPPPLLLLQLLLLLLLLQLLLQLLSEGIYLIR